MRMVIFGCFAESFDQTVCKIQEMSSEIQSHSSDSRLSKVLDELIH